jgi:four helix bundle protein
MGRARVGRMSQEADRLKMRTMRFALDVCGLLRRLSLEEPGPTVRRQLARAATGLAFYRASCRARSHREFTAKIGIAAEEADESQGWLEFMTDAKLMSNSQLATLLEESIELTKIMSASYGTAREREHRTKARSSAQPK